jgi:hypothetical protein
MCWHSGSSIVRYALSNDWLANRLKVYSSKKADALSISEAKIKKPYVRFYLSFKCFYTFKAEWMCLKPLPELHLTRFDLRQPNLNKTMPEPV